MCWDYFAKSVIHQGERADAEPVGISERKRRPECSLQKLSGEKGWQKELGDFVLLISQMVVCKQCVCSEIPTVTRLMCHFKEDSKLPSIFTMVMSSTLKKLDLGKKKKVVSQYTADPSDARSDISSVLPAPDCGIDAKVQFFLGAARGNTGNACSQVFVGKAAGTLCTVRRPGLLVGIQNPCGKSVSFIVTHSSNETGPHN